MNWILRFKNKTVLLSLVTAAVAFVYQILGVLGIVPSISSSEVIQIVGLGINLLVGLGIVVDPTTRGVTDSTQAMAYDEPKED